MRTGTGYTVLINVGGTNYYMDWPHVDPATNLSWSIQEALADVWRWIQEDNDNDVLIMPPTIGIDGHPKEARSIRASAIMHVDVLKNGHRT